MTRVLEVENVSVVDTWWAVNQNIALCLNQDDLFVGLICDGNMVFPNANPLDDNVASVTASDAHRTWKSSSTA